MKITKREEEILLEIANNPQISQKELSKKLAISRSAIAVHIMNLSIKGAIKGRGYILNTDEFITVIGGANIDIHGYSQVGLLSNDSCPGKITSSPGGVARNIAENLCRLNMRCKLMSAIGDDYHGDILMKDFENIGIDSNLILKKKNTTTSSYISFNDKNGEMKNAISDMTILKSLSPDYIEKNLKILTQSKLIVIDTNISQETIDYMFRNISNTPIYVDTVSSSKANKIRPHISKIHTLKPNKIEAETISGINIDSEKKLYEVADWFMERGLKRLFISLGSFGIFYANEKEYGLEEVRQKTLNISNVSGAGDAALAAIIYATQKRYVIRDIARGALIAANIALETSNSSSENISEDLLKIKYNETYA